MCNVMFHFFLSFSSLGPHHPPLPPLLPPPPPPPPEDGMFHNLKGRISIPKTLILQQPF